MNNRPFFENARKNNTTLDGNTPDSPRCVVHVVSYGVCGNGDGRLKCKLEPSLTSLSSRLVVVIRREDGSEAANTLLVAWRSARGTAA